MDLTREQLLDAYQKMRTIRVFEEKLNDLVVGGKLGGFLHLYAGEEAVAVGVCAHLGAADIVNSTHRVPREFGQLIEKQDAVMCTRNFSGPGV